MTDNIERFEYLIIGCGVSGLTAAASIKEKVIIVESGKDYPERNHDDPMESMMGCGGAGLFSDGKFSFYPAGTKVWKLDEKFLSPAYDALVKLMKGYIDMPTFMPFEKSNCEQNETADMPKPNGICNWGFKKYPSYYLDLAQRLELIKKIRSQISATILFNHTVIDFSRCSTGEYLVNIVGSRGPIQILAEKIIIGGGRFYPMSLKNMVPMKFRRIEYGMRIECESSIKDMQQEDIVDPKYILNEKEFQARTFCWCKNGETVLTNNGNGLRTYSGRADVEPTGKTNFGLNVRLVNLEHGALDTIVEDLVSIEPFSLDKSHISENKLSSIYGTMLGGFLWRAYEKLLEKFPSFALSMSMKIMGPTIEGVGLYPDIDEKTLKVTGHEIYCLGDASGIFRGIIASMISGLFVGELLNSSG